MRIGRNGPDSKHAQVRSVCGARRAEPPVPRMLDGKQEAEVIALRLGTPPAGYANWTLRLLARRVVELGIAPAISHETVRRALTKVE